MDEKYMDMAERIAVLEEAARHGAEERATMLKALEAIRDRQTIEAAQVSLLVNKISRWEGRFGGIIFAFGCLWAFFAGAGKAIKDWLMLLGDKVQ
jgi:hypothetical protein